MQIVGAVLAGGKSSRFGADKALLELHGRSLLQRTVATVRTVTSDVIVVGPRERQEQVDSVTVIQDERPGIGPLGGILSVLHARPGAAALVVAVDMPFLNANVLRVLVGYAGQADVVLPIAGGRGQQLHAIYGPACVPLIAAQIAGGDYKIDRFFPRVNVRRVHEAELRELDNRLDSFRNVNTPELWQEALAELQNCL